MKINVLRINFSKNIKNKKFLYIIYRKYINFECFFYILSVKLYTNIYKSKFYEKFNKNFYSFNCKYIYN